MCACACLRVCACVRSRSADETEHTHAHAHTRARCISHMGALMCVMSSGITHILRHVYALHMFASAYTYTIYALRVRCINRELRRSLVAGALGRRKKMYYWRPGVRALAKVVPCTPHIVCSMRIFLGACVRASVRVSISAKQFVLHRSDGSTLTYMYI